jgi:hypothetical protein
MSCCVFFSFFLNKKAKNGNAEFSILDYFLVFRFDFFVFLACC